jgi:hypothetical protein
VGRSGVARRSRTEELAEAFLADTRRELERATAQGSDLPARIRCVHDRPGHATPEFRTVAVPIPPGAEGASPEVLSRVIASYASRSAPAAILLALDVLAQDESGNPCPLLIAEGRDVNGVRLFFMQPFEKVGQRIAWGEPRTAGWMDPGQEEMILDAAFEQLTVRPPLSS